MKFGIFDFEMSNLNADFGILLCGVVREYGKGKAGEEVYRIDEFPCYAEQPWYDGDLALQLKGALERYDIIVSYNGRRFDVPFLNTRLALMGMEPLPKIKHIDLLYAVKYGLKLHSSSLDSVQQFFNFAMSKSRMQPSRWVKALTGSKEDMDYIVDHCRKDVAVLEAAFDRTKDFIRSIHV